MYTADGKVEKLRESFNEPGHAHELTFCCYRGLPLLSKDLTRKWFIESLDQARHEQQFQLWAYVIMPEHVHLLILPKAEDYRIDVILKAIKQPVARRAVNYLREHNPDCLQRLRVTRSSGQMEHRFWQQGGGYDRNIINDQAAWAAVRYLHDNPVRRGLVARACDWRWSSARWCAGPDDVKPGIDGTPEH